MVEPASARQTRELDEAYLRFTDYQDVASLSRLKLIIQQVMIYTQKKQVETLKILDIGCGSGSVSFPLLSLGHLVTGIDIDPESVLACRNKNQFAGAHFQVADVQSFDLGERFDMVICSEVLEHVPHPDLLIANFDKHLKQEGAVILTVPNGYSLREILVNRLGIGRMMIPLIGRSSPLKKLCDFFGVSINIDYFTDPYQRHLHFFSLRNLKKLLKLCDFQILTIHNLGLGISTPSLESMLRPLIRVEYRIAKFAPRRLAGGWLLTMNKRRR